MYTFKVTFRLYSGGLKTYTVKAGSLDSAIDKAREKASKAHLDATGQISIYRVGQIQPPLTCSITI